MDRSHVEGKRFSILGGARSGIAVAKLLNARGARVFVSDAAPAEKLQQMIAELTQEAIPFEVGGNTKRALESETIVLSPGVPSGAPVVTRARERGLKVVSEVEVASWFCSAPIVAVTGTNGKTTTTALLGRIFEDAHRRSVIAGNIGTAFSQIVDGLDETSTAILEISSFQLDHIESFRPRVAIILNITPDHLDRYEHSFEKYIASKCRVFENQRSGDTLVYNWDDEVTRGNVERQLSKEIKALPFSLRTRLDEGAFLEIGRLKTRVGSSESDVVGASELSIKGQHNLYNAMAASLAARVMGIPTASLRATLRNFKGVEHRLEFVREVNGVGYINDSKATNVDSVWYALQSFQSPLVVLLGGRDKGNDYSRLSDLVRKNVKAIVAIGESADKVVSAFASLVKVTKASNMDDAIHAASNLAARGDVVLLSPACASFDWFENYEHRGRMFKEIVNRL
jgi:UDP-N-acetylmuramoylalanine--D-glutamate ligase